MFQATSVPVDSTSGSAGVMSTGRSSTLPLSQTAPARTGNQVWGVDGPPAGLCGVERLVGHGNPRRTGAVAFGDLGPQPYGGERRFERLKKEIKRRADVVEIFPNPAAFLRVLTAVVIEAHDECHVTRRYLSDISMAELRKVIAAKHAATPLAEQRQIA